MFIGCIASDPQLDSLLMVASLGMLRSTVLTQGVLVITSVQQDHAFLVADLVLFLPGAGSVPVEVPAVFPA